MSTVKTGIPLHTMPNFLNICLHNPVQQLPFYVTGVGLAWSGIGLVGRIFVLNY